MESQTIKSKLYEDIVFTFLQTESVKQTAQKCNTYPIKVRRVLITEGLWESNTSRRIGHLFAQGVTVPEIAKQLYISEKNVQSYLPYTRGQYGGDQRSNEALRSMIYRYRIKQAEKLQVINSINNRTKSKKQQKMSLEEYKMRNKGMNIMSERTKQLEDDRSVPYAIKLHLELDMNKHYMNEREIDTLKKYGKMENGVTRDFIVPGDITLHALHYAINAAFGWQNSHLHCFLPYEEDFEKMIKKGMLVEWNRLAGMYFRYPTDDYDDIYWDDDYEPSMSVKTWLRRKYTGPYYYGGTREYFYRCQQEAEELLTWKPMLEVHKPFWEWHDEDKALKEKMDNNEGKADKIKRVAPIAEVTIKELTDTISFEGGFDELIERLPLYDLLLMPGMEQDFEQWHFINHIVSKQSKADPMCLAPMTMPILKELRYWYDYGDNWNVRIAASDVFATQEEYEKSEYPLKPLRAHRPVCVEADGLPLCDDVGGISGYCNMLEALHGDDIDEKESYKEWSSGMGWTGRNVKPENIL